MKVSLLASIFSSTQHIFPANAADVADRGFYEASAGKPCNPSDRITSEKECRDAANHQGYSYESSMSSPQSPPGCFWNSQKIVFFNTNWAASGHFSADKGGLCNDDLENFDLRLAYPGCGTEILDQGACGGCWAFSVVEAMSDRFCVIGEQITLSPQKLISCPDSKGSCRGGKTWDAFNYIIAHGLQTCTDQCKSGCEPYGSDKNQCYPKNQDPLQDRCHGCDAQCHDGSHAVFYKATAKESLLNLDLDQETVKAQLRNHGSIAATMVVYKNFRDWVNIYGADEVYDSHEGSTKLGGHGIKISGYGVSHKKKYWLVQNSWGSEWGDGGYIKMLRNTTTEEQHGIISDKVYWAMPVRRSIFETEPLPEVSPLEDDSDDSDILGGWTTADHSHPYFRDLGHTVKQQINAGGHFIGVSKAQTQVVAGVRVRLNIDTTHGPLEVETKVDLEGNVLSSETVVLSSADQVVV